MFADLSKFKVVYRERVLNAVALLDYEGRSGDEINGAQSLKFITILAIDNNGNLKVIDDEAWMFQFVPVIGGNEQ